MKYDGPVIKTEKESWEEKKKTDKSWSRRNIFRKACSDMVNAEMD